MNISPTIEFIYGLVEMAYDDQWITVNSSGKEGAGSPVLLGEGGEIKGGMGGKFTGKNMGEAVKASKKATVSKQTGGFDKNKESFITDALKIQRITNFNKTIDEDENIALERYSGNSYKNVNNALRNPDYVFGYANKWVKDTINSLDSVFEGVEGIKQPIMVMRGVNPKRYESLVEGDIFQDKGFLSTTTNNDIASSFGLGKSLKGEKQMIMHIKLPKGSKAINIKKFSIKREEDEILLPRGQKYRVLGKTKGIDGNDVLTVELFDKT